MWYTYTVSSRRLLVFSWLGIFISKLRPVRILRSSASFVSWLGRVFLGSKRVFCSWKHEIKSVINSYLNFAIQLIQLIQLLTAVKSSQTHSPTCSTYCVAKCIYAAYTAEPYVPGTWYTDYTNYRYLLNSEAQLLLLQCILCTAVHIAAYSLHHSNTI